LRSNECLFRNTLCHWLCQLELGVAAVRTVSIPDRQNVPPDI